MKIFFGYDYPQSGTESVMNAIAEGLRTLGHTVDTKVVWGDQRIRVNPPDLSSYDFGHFWNMRSAMTLRDVCLLPSWGVTAHGFGGSGQEQREVQDYYISAFRGMRPDWIHVMDTYTLQILAREGLFPFFTPQCITAEGFDRQPLLGTDVLSSIGHDGDGFKRLDIVQRIADALDIPAILFNSSNGEVDKAGVVDIYRLSSIYVNACFGGCGPVPPQEALLCGRPVLTTRLDTMNHIIKPGVNGEFFDGTVEDGVRKVKRIMNNYAHYYQGTLETRLFDPLACATLFLEEVSERLA